MKKIAVLGGNGKKFFFGINEGKYGPKGEGEEKREIRVYGRQTKKQQYRPRQEKKGGGGGVPKGGAKLKGGVKFFSDVRKIIRGPH